MFDNFYSYYKKLIFFYKKKLTSKIKFNFFKFIIEYKKIINIEFISKIDDFLANLITFSYDYIYFFLQRLFYVYNYLYFSLSNSIFFTFIKKRIFIKKNNFFFSKKNYFSFYHLPFIENQIFFYYYYKKKNDSFFYNFFFFNTSLYSFFYSHNFFYKEFNSVINNFLNISNLYTNTLDLYQNYTISNISYKNHLKKIISNKKCFFFYSSFFSIIHSILKCQTQRMDYFFFISEYDLKDLTMINQSQSSNHFFKFYFKYYQNIFLNLNLKPFNLINTIQLNIHFLFFFKNYTSLFKKKYFFLFYNYFYNKLIDYKNSLFLLTSYKNKKKYLLSNKYFFLNHLVKYIFLKNKFKNAFI